MAKKATKKPAVLAPVETVLVEQIYTFPEMGVAVKATNLEEATIAAKKKAKEK